MKQRNCLLFSIVFAFLIFSTSCQQAAPLPTPTATLAPTPTIAPTPTSLPTQTPIPTKTADWTFTAGGQIVGPITVSDGVVYFGNSEGYLFAVDAATHALKWKFQAGGPVWSRPAVYKDLVYIAGDDSALYAVSNDDGALVWKTPIGSFKYNRDSLYPGVEEGIDFFTSSPVVQDDVIYVGGTNKYFYAIDAITGKVNWKFAVAADKVRNTPVVGNNMVYFGDFGNDFYAVNIKDGTLVWKYHTSDMFLSSGSTLVEQTIYIVRFLAIVALDASTGKEEMIIVEFPNNPGWYLMGAFNTPTVESGVLYGVGFKNDTWLAIAAYDIESGEQLWGTDVPGYFSREIASPVIGNANIYIGMAKTGFFAIDKKTGEVKWNISVRSGSADLGVWGTAAIADGMVYFGGLDGVLYAVKDQ